MPVRRSHLKNLYGANLADHSSNPSSVFTKPRRLPKCQRHIRRNWYLCIRICAQKIDSRPLHQI